MISKLFTGILLLFLCACSASPVSTDEGNSTRPFRLSQENPDYELTEKGSLVIVGGAMRDSAIFAAFMMNAGGYDAPIIVIPTAGSDTISDENLERYKKWATDLGATQVTVLHTKDRELADSDEFVQPIVDASGVWFSGGRQWRIADSFLNTQTHEEIKNLLRRGGVVGGSSAGATIQGAYLARGDTGGNREMMGDHDEGMNLFPNTAIDQHLLKRNRQFDLVEIIETHPELLGIGLDENTAIVVHGDTFKVMGEGYVAIYDAAVWEKETTSNNGSFFLLSSGDVYNFKTRMVSQWNSRGREIEAITED